MFGLFGKDSNASIERLCGYTILNTVYCMLVQGISNRCRGFIERVTRESSTPQLLAGIPTVTAITCTPYRRSVVGWHLWRTRPRSSYHLLLLHDLALLPQVLCKVPHTALYIKKADISKPMFVEMYYV